MAKIRFILIALCSVLLFSCSKDEVDLDDVTNVVNFKVTSDSPNQPFEISATDGYHFKTSGNWEKKITTKNYFASLIIECDNPNTLLKGQIYVNGILVRKKEGNQYIHIGLRLKGKE